MELHPSVPGLAEDDVLQKAHCFAVLQLAVPLHADPHVPRLPGVGHELHCIVCVRVCVCMCVRA